MILKENTKSISIKLIDNHRFQLEKEKRERDRLKFIKIRNNMEINNEPITLYDAWYYNDNLSRDKWKSSIIKELYTCIREICLK